MSEDGLMKNEHEVYFEVAYFDTEGPMQRLRFEAEDEALASWEKLSGNSWKSGVELRRIEVLKRGETR